LYVTDFKGNDPKFLYYLLKTIDFDQFNSGSAQKSLNRNAVYPFEVEIPKSRAEQQRISSVLSALEEKTEINHQINQTLEQMAQAIFKSWFVDFEPVKAKIAALEAGGSEEDALLAAMQAIAGDAQECSNSAKCSAPGAATGVKLARLQAEQPERYAELRATAKLFPSAMQDSELGEIPEGWSVSSIYEIADVVYGAPFKSKLFNQIGDGTPLIRIRDLKNERPGVRTPEEHPKGYLVQNGDLLVGMDGEFKPYIWGSGPAWMNQRVCCFKPKDSYSVGLIKGFIEPQLRELELTATATTVIHLGKGDINRFEFLNSGSPLLRVFSKITNSLIEQIIMNKSSTSTLEQLRNALLPKLLSGELSVSDAETWPEEAEEHANV
jgi:type I restriction enzyme S subunit